MNQLTINYKAETILDVDTLIALEVINPLSYIQFSIDLISAGLDLTEQEEVLKIIHKNVQRISSFANNIKNIKD
jgi:nitrogen-specific signal transduction histidine kinase